jgi:hypothetical protein
LLDDAHSLQLHMSAEKSASAVVLPKHTKIGQFFQFFKNGEFSPKNTTSDKTFQI